MIQISISNNDGKADAGAPCNAMQSVVLGVEQGDKSIQASLPVDRRRSENKDITAHRQRVGFYFDRNLYNLVKERASKTGVSINTIVQMAVAKFLNQ